MRVLVTGSSGYIGHHITEMLLAKGHSVVGLDTDLFKSCLFQSENKHNSDNRGFPVLNIDLRDVTVEDLNGFDACIHLAGLSNDPLGKFDPQLTDAINHVASVKLAELCREAGMKRFVAASSCSIYGASDTGLLNEDSAFRPQTAYAQSKLKMEEGVSKLANVEFSPSFMRGGTVYGYSPMIRFDLVVNNLVAWASSTGKVLLKSNGVAWRPFIHVNDLAAAFCEVLAAPQNKVHNQPFNLAPIGENFQIKSIAKAIHEQLPDATITFEGSAEQDTRNYRVCGKKLDSLLGANWNKMNITSGIAELIEVFSKTPPHPDDFEGARYQRLAHLEQKIADGEITTDLRTKHHIARNHA